MNIRDLVIKQDYTDTDLAETLSPKLEIRKPNKTEFFRIFSGDDFKRGPLAMYEDPQDKEIYVVAPHMLDAMGQNYHHAMLTLAVNKDGVMFAWAVKQCCSRGKDNSWYKSAREVSLMAEKKWLRMEADSSKCRYSIIISKKSFPMPTPSQTFEEMLQMALEGRVIDSNEHIVIKKLEGSV